MRKIPEPIERHNCHLYARDCRRIEAMFMPRLRFNTAVRELLRQMLDRIEEQAKAKHQQVPELDIELGEVDG